VEARRRARDQLREQRALRRRVTLDALALATANRDRWRARGNARLVARYEAVMRRAEQALATLDSAGLLWWLICQQHAGTLADAGHFFDYVRTPQTYTGQHLPPAIIAAQLDRLAAHWRGWLTVQNLLTAAGLRASLGRNCAERRNNERGDQSGRPAHVVAHSSQRRAATSARCLAS